MAASDHTASGAVTSAPDETAPPEPPPTGRRVAYNTLAQAAGKAAVIAIAAVSIAVLTRYLGPEGYGRYSLALVYVQTFGVLADVGLLTIVVREISRDAGRRDELVGNALTMRAVLWVAVIAVAAVVSLALPYDRDVRLGILLAGIPLLFGLLTSAMIAPLQAELKMDRVAVAETLGRAGGLAAVGVVIWQDWGYFAAIGAAGAGALVALIGTTVAARPYVRIRPRADLQVWRRLWGLSLPVGLALVINQLYVRADTLIISGLRSVAEVGPYVLAYRVIEMVALFGGVFLASVFPLMSRQPIGGPAFRATVQQAWDVLVVLGVPVAVLGAVLAPELIALAGGSDFDAAITPLRVLLPAAVLGLINGIFGFALIAADRQRRALWLNVVGLSFNVGANLILVPAYGIVAAAAVTVASELLVLGGSVLLMRRHIGFFPRAGTLWAALAAVAPALAAVLIAGDQHTVVLVALGAIAYGAIVLALSPRTRRLARMAVAR